MYISCCASCPVLKADDRRCPSKARLQIRQQSFAAWQQPMCERWDLQQVQRHLFNTQLQILKLPDEGSRCAEHCFGQSHKGQWHSISTPTTNKQWMGCDMQVKQQCTWHFGARAEVCLKFAVMPLRQARHGCPAGTWICCNIGSKDATKSMLLKAALFGHVLCMFRYADMCPTEQVDWMTGPYVCVSVLVSAKLSTTKICCL